MDVAVIGLLGIHYVGTRFTAETLEREVVGESFGTSFVSWRTGLGLGIRFGCPEEISLNVSSSPSTWQSATFWICWAGGLILTGLRR